MPELTHLSDAYSELGEAITTNPADEAPLRVTEVAVQRITGATWASLTVLTRGQLTTVAATHQTAVAADRMQYDLEEGPCFATVETGQSAMLAADLLADGRWPSFAAASRPLGVRALLAFRLGLEADDGDDLDGTTASLNIYGRSADGFGEDAVMLGTLLAAHASTALVASRYQHQLHHLQIALETNREIGVAMGILMQQHKVTEARAFALLRIASQHTNRKLRDVAAETARTGILDLPSS